MKRTKDDAEYQQSSRDASAEEDPGDTDSIASVFDSAPDRFPSRRRSRNIASNHFDEGENSATTSDIVTNGHVVRPRRKEAPRAVDVADKRYVDVDSETGRLMNPPPMDRALRVYSDGIFDLFHIGFGPFLGDSLILGTCDNWSKQRNHFLTCIYWLEYRMMR